MDLAERVDRLNRSPIAQAAWQHMERILDDILAEAIQIQQIHAPTFHELARANHALSRFGNLGLEDATIDAVYNTSGRLRGSDPQAPALLVSAHTDTVFASNTDLTVRREEDRVYGPGLGDNSLGVAALIALADTLRQYHITSLGDIWFLANSREEGLGDLGGIRAFYQKHGQSLGAAIVLEGMALGQVYHAGIAVRRLHITCQASGGHSWQRFGEPNAIHTLVQIGAQVANLQPPTEPKTTFNIGLIEGGHSINSLATEAGFYLDLRSQDTKTLAHLEGQVMDIVHHYQATDSVTIMVDVVGDRPAGMIERSHPLVRAAEAALQIVGIQPSLEASSTDANLLLANGVPAVTIGITRGSHAHRPDEYIEIAPIGSGLRQVLLLTLAACGWEPAD